MHVFPIVVENRCFGAAAEMFFHKYEEFSPHLAAHQVSRQDTLHVGDRTFEMRFLKSVHSEADTSIWMPTYRERVNAMVKQGKSLNEIKKLRRPEDWQGKDRFPNNIEAAYRAVSGEQR